MKLCIILTVLLTTGCSGTSTSTGDAVALFTQACNVPLSADLTISRWGRKLVVHCAEVSDD
jgi:hypothetical protein